MTASGSITLTLPKKHPPQEVSNTLILRSSPASASSTEAAVGSDRTVAAAQATLAELQTSATAASAVPMPACRVSVEKPISFAKRLSNLLAKMQASPAFSPEERARIAGWIREFVSGFSYYSQGRNEGVSLALCYLLCRVIHPAINATKQNDPQEMELAQFGARLKNLLATTVPEGETVDQFIIVYKEFLEQKQLMDQKLDIIVRVFQEAMNRLYATGKRLNNDLVERVQRLELKLDQANRDQREGMGEVHASLEGQANRVQLLFDEYDEIMKTLQIQEDKTKQLTASFISILEDCKRSLQRLRR